MVEITIQNYTADKAVYKFKYQSLHRRHEDVHQYF